MQVWRNCQTLSEQTSDLSALLNATYIFNCEQHFSFFIFWTRLTVTGPVRVYYMSESSCVFMAFVSALYEVLIRSSIGISSWCCYGLDAPMSGHLEWWDTTDIRLQAIQSHYLLCMRSLLKTKCIQGLTWAKEYRPLKLSPWVIRQAGIYPSDAPADGTLLQKTPWNHYTTTALTPSSDPNLKACSTSWGGWTHGNHMVAGLACRGDAPTPSSSWSPSFLDGAGHTGTDTVMQHSDTLGA
jgi:hypothetical protein